MTARRWVPWLAAGVCVLGGFEEAEAGVPAWCKGKTFDANSSDLNALKRTEPDYVVRAIAQTMCSTSEEVVQHQATIDKARQAWSKKLGMTDADWSDAVEFVDNRDGEFPKIELSTKVIAQMTPMDQYKLIREGVSDRLEHPLYAADMFEPNLSEVGRLALIEWCLKERVEHSYVHQHAACQGDIDAWNAGKFATQLRSDTAHDGATRMLLRLRALELQSALKEYADARTKLIKQDETYKQVFDAGARGRADWAKGVGTNKALLDLVSATESAHLSGSRKLYGDCKTTTAAALSKAVGALPAKTFEGMHDVRMDPTEGFAAKAAPVLVTTPEVNLAATAFVLCDPKTHTADWLASFLQEVPGYRGPRAAAAAEVLNTKFEFDDVNANKLTNPELRGRPFARSGGAASSAGGVVAKVTPGKESASVALKKTKVKRLQCLQVKYSNRVTRIRSDGSLEYAGTCLKSGMVTVDTTWEDFKIRSEFVPLLKPGVVFSAIGSDTAQDVIAIWANADAKTPSIVLGAKLK